MLSQARPAACDAAGPVADSSLRFGLDFFLACFLGSLLRRVDSIGGVCCRSVLEDRDLAMDLRDDVEGILAGCDSKSVVKGFWFWTSVIDSLLGLV